MTEYLEFNSALDGDAFAKAFERDGYVRIPNLLKPASAEVYARVLETQTPWRLTICDDGSPERDLYDPTRINEIGRDELGKRLSAAAQAARDGFSYVYLSYPLIYAMMNGWDPGHPIHAMTEMVNSPEFLAFCRKVLGRDDVLKADAQATLFRPGDFLSLHDDGRHDYRLAAYTIGFSRPWRPDWGGQLLFHDEVGDVTHGFAPAFNTLTLFKVPQHHSVAAVAPYAGGPRLSIVGWVRNDAPTKA